MSGFHHVEVWLADFEKVRSAWGWLLTEVGFHLAQRWNGGESWHAGGAYLTLTSSPNVRNVAHDRRQPGVNHLAFKAGSASDVDAVMSAAPERGWQPLYHDRYPHAGGPNHYAGWLENSAGFKIEIVATGE